ncbi:glycoside hydrolase family 10 protein [Verrucomicrobiota bacterium sgz303538]
MLSPRLRYSLAAVVIAAAAAGLLAPSLRRSAEPKQSAPTITLEASLPDSKALSEPLSPAPLQLGPSLAPVAPEQTLKLELFRPSTITPPPLTREFRAAWIASVGNIDWPSKPGLSPEAQRAELIDLLDHAAALRLNAIVLQVRPASDALYASKLEPWSQYLTGTMGAAPTPYYDPLEFAVTEAHKRGLELHAWFNPFRALTTARNAAGASSNHITRTHPELVRRYGDLFWMDPGEPAARSYVLDVIADVVKRYDIDAVHLDDYFYPYRVKGSGGRPVEFPDEPSWNKYLADGGTLTRNDWRRENINIFVRDLYSRIKAEKSWVKLGISPFGIWRPQKEPLISGLDSFEELYADSRKWLENGWLDYFAPQLYWSSDAPKHSYPVLLQWWADANKMQRHLWPGIATDRIGKERPASDILNQISLTRKTLQAAGNIHWHFKSLVNNLGQISDQLSNTLYSEPALVPAFAWLSSAAISTPEVSFASMQLKWSIKDSTQAKQWALQIKRQGKWLLEILPSTSTTRLFDKNDLPEAVAVTAIDRFGNASPAVVIERADLKDSVAANTEHSEAKSL